MTPEKSRTASSPDTAPVADVATHKNIGQTARKAAADQPVPAADQPSFELSATQIVAGTAAAVTAAVLGSRLGVAGTIVGAALASLISIVAGAVYSHSISAARRRVRTAISQRGSEPAMTGHDLLLLRSVNGPGLIDDTPRPDRSTRTTPRRPRMRGVLLGAAAAGALFVGAIAIVTGVETIKGSPLAGGAPGGLSLLGGARSGDQPDPVTTPPATSRSTGTTGTSATTSRPTGSPAPTTRPTGATTPTTPTRPAPTTTPPGTSSGNQAPPATGASGDSTTASTAGNGTTPPPTSGTAPATGSATTPTGTGTETGSSTPTAAPVGSAQPT